MLVHEGHGIFRRILLAKCSNGLEQAIWRSLLFERLQREVSVVPLQAKQRQEMYIKEGDIGLDISQKGDIICRMCISSSPRRGQATWLVLLKQRKSHMSSSPKSMPIG